MKQWQFWIDRGGTFTDIVAKNPHGQRLTYKLLSENPSHYPDAAIAGIRHLMGLSTYDPLPIDGIAQVKIGTTLATNALLERKGEPTALLITQGFKDALRIGYQNRPHIFDRHIVLPEMLYALSVEIEERISAEGKILIPLDEDKTRQSLEKARASGLTSCAIVLMHGYRYPDHELKLAKLAQEAGFTQICVSHQVSALMKLIARGDTTMADAYLSPLLHRYVQGLSQALKGVRLHFMQSNGGLSGASGFQGKNSLLSGPAGGVVGMVKTAMKAGFEKLIGFDMGGTSTDVSHFNGGYERTFDDVIGGVRLRAPMMKIHTVAAGGGSLLKYDGFRMQVGPESAGAQPGPACYGLNGPLTVTDCNALLGRIQADFFPSCFGVSGKEHLSRIQSEQQFKSLLRDIQKIHSHYTTIEQVAEGYLNIAITNMANAIKKISIARGFDLSTYTLVGFGGAAGQQVCQVAQTIGVKQVFIPAHSGVLSAYGIGLADITVVREKSFERKLEPQLLNPLLELIEELSFECNAAIQAQDPLSQPAEFQAYLRIKYEGTDSVLDIAFVRFEPISLAFETLHQQHFGFLMREKALIVEAVWVEATAKTEALPQSALPFHLLPGTTDAIPPYSISSAKYVKKYPLYNRKQWQEVPLYEARLLEPGNRILGPALICEEHTTIVVDPDWQLEVNENRDFILLNLQSAQRPDRLSPIMDPVYLEVFNNVFMSIAEQMGLRLANTAMSVNIKERLDFSCALFDGQGQLVANAPHMPVHLGSMGESVQAVIEHNGAQMREGDSFMLNDPYHGGTHLPDITLVTPVFYQNSPKPTFFVASRGHHSDIGGLTPGSMPPHSTHIDQEGILIRNCKLVDQGQFCEAAVKALLTAGPYPARNPEQNIADLKAMIAANQKGVMELTQAVKYWGLPVVENYMQFVQHNAEEAVRRVISQLEDGQFQYAMDNGSIIAVSIRVDRKKRHATIDFSGTSEQKNNNFNAPTAITKAAVLYVFRSLIKDNIPLNAGCLKPLTIVIPQHCLLNPLYPAAVVAGNVETSQCITDALYGALGVMGASQGTMNNFTFGNDRYQYYETIAGGSGAGEGFDGTDVVQTHMTNSRLTDPEVLEWRYPVVLETFEIRANSGGEGQFRGGNGAKRRIRFLEPMTAAILSNHRKVAPYGMAGGGAGALGLNRVIRSNGQMLDLPACAALVMNTGDCVEIITPGGGAYGKALQ